LDGATVVDLSPAAADALGIDPFTAGHGVMIASVGEGFAARIGLQKGDLISQINGQSVTTVHALQAVLAQGSGAWRLVIQRGGQTITAEFRL
jgi:S1-C subfamily serine protease